ncbi:hypothetical protein KJ780_04795 [Candidatus Micrarchaeota archaeon]|nr:hypothetical protein [Candidatus Micrarchaeota archaeon]
MDELSSELRKRITAEDWEYFGHLASTFSLELETTGVKTAKFQKELQMIRKVLHAYMTHEEGRARFISPRFMIGMYKTIKGVEKKIAEDEQKHVEFLAFLNALLYKLRQEKLIVYKTLEKTREFQRHKRKGDRL